MYIWELTIREITENDWIFSAENDNGCYFEIESPELGAGIHRIVNIILCDCPCATVYVTDLTRNYDYVRSILEKKQVPFELC